MVYQYVLYSIPIIIISSSILFVVFAFIEKNNLLKIKKYSLIFLAYILAVPLFLIIVENHLLENSYGFWYIPYFKCEIFVEEMFIDIIYFMDVLFMIIFAIINKGIKKTLVSFFIFYLLSTFLIYLIYINHYIMV